YTTAGPSGQQRAAPADDRSNVRGCRWRARLAPMAEAHGACAELAGSRWRRELTDAGHDRRDRLVVGHKPHVDLGRARGQHADGCLDLESAPAIADLSPDLAPLHPHDARHTGVLLPA